MTISSYKQWPAHRRGAAVARKGLRLCQAARRAARLSTAFKQFAASRLHAAAVSPHALQRHRRQFSLLLAADRRAPHTSPCRHGATFGQSTPSPAGAFMPPVSQHCDHAGFRFRSNAPAPYAHRLAAGALVLPSARASRRANTHITIPRLALCSRSIAASAPSGHTHVLARNACHGNTDSLSSGQNRAFHAPCTNRATLRYPAGSTRCSRNQRQLQPCTGNMPSAKTIGASIKGT
jgi:hypothetical protein